MLLQLELLPEQHQALHLHLLVLVPLVLVDLLLQARLHLEQLVLVRQQLVQRLGLHQALRLLVPELLGLVGPLLQARLHLVEQQLGQRLGLHQALQ